MSLTSKNKGILGEAKVLAKFIELNCRVSIPYGDNAPYDLIVDCGGALLKIQVKTSECTSEGKTAFTLGRRRRNSFEQKNIKYANDEIDYFALYSIVRDNIYLISAKEAPAEEISIRYELPKNNQLNAVRMEKDYLIDYVINSLRNSCDNSLNEYNYSR